MTRAYEVPRFSGLEFAVPGSRTTNHELKHVSTLERENLAGQR